MITTAAAAAAVAVDQHTTQEALKHSTKAPWIWKLLAGEPRGIPGCRCLRCCGIPSSCMRAHRRLLETQKKLTYTRRLCESSSERGTFDLSLRRVVELKTFVSNGSENYTPVIGRKNIDCFSILFRCWAMMPAAQRYEHKLQGTNTHPIETLIALCFNASSHKQSCSTTRPR